MNLKSLLIGIGAILLVGAGAAWSVGSKPENWAWTLAPKIAGYKPDPKDVNFYYPLPEVVEFTSPFGWRIHPLYGDRRLHAGVDLGAPQGMPVLSAHAGYVRYADWGDGYGNMVIVEYADGKYETLYGHLSEIAVKEGEAVRPRQVIGLVGATGGVTGPHLHFELRKKTGDDFEPIDPMAQVKSVEPFVAVRPIDGQQLASKGVEEDRKQFQQGATNPDNREASTQPYVAPGMKATDNGSLSFDPSGFTK